MTMLSVLLSLVLAHGPLVKIVKTVASAERRTVGSDCQKSYQSAARRSQWSFIRRLVRRLAALIAGSKLARQLGPPKQVCQDLGSSVPVELADETVGRVSSLRLSAASSPMRTRRTGALGCFLSRGIGRKRLVMLVGIAFVHCA